MESVKDVVFEFYDIVFIIGYFYSGVNMEVKKYNIEKLGEKVYFDIGFLWILCLI